MDQGQRNIIYAPGIRTGGGKTLLIDLLKSLNPQCDIAWIEPQIIEEIQNLTNVQLVRCRQHKVLWPFDQRDIFKIVQPDDHFIHFSNLPPVVTLPCQTTSFIQNRLMIDGQPKHSPIVRNLNYLIMRGLFRKFYKNSQNYVVQTPSMKKALQKFMPQLQNILERKIVPKDVLELFENITTEKHRTNEFIYVTSDKSHKNYFRLLEAWKILADQGVKPQLELIFNEIKDPQNKIKIFDAAEKIGDHIKIEINLSHQQVKEHLQNSYCLVYPSLVESFGLPLIEARACGLSILASDLEFVTEIDQPEASFQPLNSNNIAAVVKNFYQSDKFRTPVLPSEKFVKSLCASNSLLEISNHTST